MYCRNCQYPLKKLKEHRCPECGTTFDPENRETWLEQPHQSLRGLTLVVRLIMLYPLLPIGFLLLTWGAAWLSLGHQPQPYVDDPKYINDTVSLLHYVTAVLLVIGMGTSAVAGIAGVIVHSVVTMVQEDDLIVTIKLALTGLVCWVLLIGVLLRDPLSMFTWLFD